jgi:hypothetical protein
MLVNTSLPSSPKKPRHFIVAGGAEQLLLLRCPGSPMRIAQFYSAPQPPRPDCRDRAPRLAGQLLIVNNAELRLFLRCPRPGWTKVAHQPSSNDTSSRGSIFFCLHCAFTENLPGKHRLTGKMSPFYNDVAFLQWVSIAIPACSLYKRGRTKTKGRIIQLASPKEASKIGIKN